MLRIGSGRRGCPEARWPLTCCRRGAGFAGLVPGLAYIVGTAAHLLGHVEGQLVLARVVEVAVAHALPHVCGRTESKVSLVHSRPHKFWEKSPLISTDLHLSPPGAIYP